MGDERDITPGGIDPVGFVDHLRRLGVVDDQNLEAVALRLRGQTKESCLFFLVDKGFAEFRVAVKQGFLDDPVYRADVGAGGIALGFVVLLALDQEIETIFGDEYEVGAALAGEGADRLHELTHLLAVIENNAADLWRGFLLFNGPSLDAHPAFFLGFGGTGDEDKESQKNGNQRSVHRRSPRCGGNPGHANIATTSSAMANAAVRPGDSIPKRFINPLTPCAAGP